LSIFSPLSIYTYKRLFSAQIIALAGTGLTTVALALLAHDLAGGNAGQVLGIALALKMIAYALIAPLFGAVAQKLPRRTLLVTLDILRACRVALCH
jgi:MFS family permease